MILSLHAEDSMQCDIFKVLKVAKQTVSDIRFQVQTDPLGLILSHTDQTKLKKKTKGKQKKQKNRKTQFERRFSKIPPLK